MTWVRTTWFRRGAINLAALGVGVSVAIFGWFGYHAIVEWRKNSTMLAERRAAETADLLVTALTRDMRGVQESVLGSSRWDDAMLAPPFEVTTLVASAFARYPYPESFFSWRRGAEARDANFFNRSDRPPSWAALDGVPPRFPVVRTRAPAVSRALLGRALEDAANSRSFSIFEARVGDTRYQVIARLVYSDPFRERLSDIFGFTVSLPWVRKRYFPELTGEVIRIGAPGSMLASAVLDEDDHLVAGQLLATEHGPVSRRPFSLTFFDPFLVALDPPQDLTGANWTVEVSAVDDPTLLEGIRGANRTLTMASLAAMTMAIGLLLTARAASADARLSEARSEFVSTVTHELKTPVAAILALGDTLMRGRTTGAENVHEYAQLVVREAKHLARLVDNLLAYGRITDVAEAYCFEAVDLGGLVEEVEQQFRTQIRDGHIEWHVEISPDLPPVWADRTALRLTLDNVIDNAIRYSEVERWLEIRAWQHSASDVVVEVSDHGVGIEAHEIGRVMGKFVRGRAAKSSGSGLGLAIANRVIRDHGGSVSIRSVVGVGTTVSLNVAIAQEQREEAHSGR